MTRIVFCDTECTHLDRKSRRIWELAYIVRDPGAPDVERHEFLHVPLDKADPQSLRVGGYWERHPMPYRDGWGVGMKPSDQIASEVAHDFHGATLVGACPSFDEETLAKLLRCHGLRETWDHRLLDVGTLVMGWFAAVGRDGVDGCDSPRTPLSLDKAASILNLPWPDGSRHTALGDARIVRDIYDRVMGVK